MSTLHWMAHQPAPLDARITHAAATGVAEVARELAQDGLAFDTRLASQVRQRFASFPAGPLFCKCIVEAAQWAGFVDDPDWESDAMRYLENQAVHIKQKYRTGYHAANPIAYLDTWVAIIGDPNIPVPPDVRATSAKLLRFFHDAFATLKNLEWKRQRSQVGPWTFYGAFKIFLVHETELWDDATIDAIPLPMGGEAQGYSFERGWALLESLAVVPVIAAAKKFDDGLRRFDQVHAQVTKLAALASTRALHVNSGIYCIGSP
jgi:hypothetical protein